MPGFGRLSGAIGFIRGLGARNGAKMAEAVVADKAISHSIASDLSGFSTRYLTNRNMAIAAATGVGIYGATRLSDNRSIRSFGNFAGMVGVGAGGFAGARAGWSRWGGEAKAAASSLGSKMGMGPAKARRVNTSRAYKNYVARNAAAGYTQRRAAGEMLNDMFVRGEYGGDRNVGPSSAMDITQSYANRMTRY